MRSWRSLASLVLVFSIGCNSGTEPTPSSRPGFSHTGTPDISGSIFLGSDDQNICSVFSPETPLFIRAFTTDLGSTGSSVAICPANDFSMPVEPGTYLVRVSLPTDQLLGLLPRRWLEPVPVTVDADDVIKDIRVQDGSQLLGRATVDGVPAPGVSLTAFYADLPGFAGNFGASGLDGTWDDGTGRSAMILQNDLDYVFSGCEGLPVPGIKSITGFPVGPVQFPSGTDRVNCEFTSGDALQYTHQGTRLKLSSFPGDIGGMSVPLLFPDVGFGYSAQFPLPAGQPPRAGPDLSNRQLFRGGLVLGIGPDVALGGTELEGFVACSVSPCRAFGFDGEAAVIERSGGRKDITWTYSDAGSQRPLGLRVIQLSFDGQNGRDYVLYGFRIFNQGTRPVTFTPGMFLDFDVDPEFFSNVGYTALDGRLMVTTGAGEGGPHLGGFVVQSKPVRGNYFFDSNLFLSESKVVAALRGETRKPTVPDPTDVRQLQGGNTVKLKPGKSTDFWMAIVAGGSRAEIIASARAALADAKARGKNKDTFSAPSGHRKALARSRGAALSKSGALRTKKLCKAGCEPDR